MKNKIKYILILVFFTETVLISCKKDNTIDNNNNGGGYPYNYQTYNCFIKGIVYDSITGLPIEGAVIIGVGMNNTYSTYPHDTTDQFGSYTVSFWWDNHHYPKQNGQYLQVNTHTGNSVGYVKFLSDSLKSGDTLYYNLYTLPLGHIKIHLKDTSSSSDFYLKYYMNLFFHDLSSVYTFSSPAITDTSFVMNALPNRNANINWSYYKDTIKVSCSTNVYVPHSDTSNVEIIF